MNTNGYKATGALSAGEAYDAMYETVFDLIVSDIMMPGIDGFEFAKTVRSLNENIPILFMTARDDFASKQRGYRIGVDDYMVKPIDLDELFLRIGALLRRAKIAASRKLEMGNFSMDMVKSLKDHKYENLILTTLFTGLREGEVCGLKWDCVNLETGTILVDKQLQSLRKSVRGNREKYALVPTKNGKERYLTIAPFVVELLKKEKTKQDANRTYYEDLYEESGLVFTDESGHRITPQAAYRAFKLKVAELGMPNVRFHDLRHSYAVASLRSGDDVKTVQENLGHATAAFTLDVYGHVTEQMKTESANRMQAFIQSVSA